MKPGFRVLIFSWRRAVFSGLLAASVILVAIVVLNQPTLRTIARVDDLAEKFEETVFGSDDGWEVSKIFRWNGDIRIWLDHGLSASLRAKLWDYSGQLSILTGLRISASPTKDVANIHLYYVPRARFAEVVRRHGKISQPAISFIESVPCFAHVPNDRYILDRAVIGIGTLLSRRSTESCLLEELYQALGPAKNSWKLLPSISSGDGSATELSVNDKILIRTLYDDRITPGMKRAEAMRIALGVIAALVEAVKENGEAALIHPRYRSHATTN